MGDSSNQSAVEVARINARQVILVTVITVMGAIGGALIQGLFASRKVESLQGQLATSTAKTEDLQKDLKDSAIESEALYRLTADHLRGDLTSTSGKGEAAQVAGLSETELNFRRLRRAVFLNMSALRGNATILEKTIDTLERQGYPWLKPQKGRIIADLPELKQVRLRWLEDEAIPQLQRAITESSRSVVQTPPEARVPLPALVQILSSPSRETPSVTLTNLEGLKAEVAMLKASM